MCAVKEIINHIESNHEQSQCSRNWETDLSMFLEQVRRNREFLQGCNLRTFCSSIFGYGGHLTPCLPLALFRELLFMF